MKKLSFIIIVTLFSINATGQVWIDSGAVWHYDFWVVGGFGFEKYEYMKDTIISGKNCQKITGTRYVFGHDTNNNVFLLGNQNFGNQFTYVSGDTVFYLNNGEFFVLYNFRATIGDKWVVATSNPFSECDDTSRIEVVDTGKITLNSVKYRFITVQPTSNSPLGLKGTYVERFGNINSSFAPFQYMFPNGYQCDSLTPIGEWIFYKFKCFEDSSFMLYNPSTQDCEYYLTHLGINEANRQEIKCYPNPTTGQVNIETNPLEEKFIEIYNYQGSLTRSFYLTESIEKIDISDLKTGMYFIRIKSKTKDNCIKIIKE